MGTLFLPHGLPGSGKTTWSEKMVSNNSNLDVHSLDDIRIEFFGSDYFIRSLYVEKETIAIGEQISRIRKSLQNNRDVITDASNLKPHRISQLIREIGPLKYSIQQVYFDVPLEQVFKQNQKRGERGGRLVPISTIVEMHQFSYENGHLKAIEFESVFPHDLLPPIWIS